MSEIDEIASVLANHTPYDSPSWVGVLRQIELDGYRVVRRAGSDRAADLSAAWAEAEALAKAKGWLLGLVAHGGQYLAEAWEDDEAYASGEAVAEAFADTPAAALRALAERLRERTG